MTQIRFIVTLLRANPIGGGLLKIEQQWDGQTFDTYEQAQEWIDQIERGSGPAEIHKLHFPSENQP